MAPMSDLTNNAANETARDPFAPPTPGAAVPATRPTVSWAAAAPTAGSNVRLVTPGGRLGAFLLECVLCLFTLVIGWLIWSLVVWGRGQTPAKQVLKMVCLNQRTGQPMTWGQMFLREFVIKGIAFGFVNAITFSVFWLVDSFMVMREDRRSLHDMVAGSVVAYA